MPGRRGIVPGRLGAKGATMRRGKWFAVIIGVVLAGLLAGCPFANGKQGPTESGEPEQFVDQIPIDPMPSYMVKVYDKQKNTLVDVYWDSLTNSTKRDMLSVHTDHVTVYERSTSGRLSFSSASVSAKDKRYVIIFDFIKGRVERICDADDKYLGMGHVGVGVRVKARVTANEAGLDLGSLTALGLQASQQKMKGELLVQAFGVDSASISDLMPFTVEISQSSLQTTMQALSAVKAKMWDDKTSITPYIVSIAYADNATRNSAPRCGGSLQGASAGAGGASGGIGQKSKAGGADVMSLQGVTGTGGSSGSTVGSRQGAILPGAPSPVR